MIHASIFFKTREEVTLARLLYFFFLVIGVMLAACNSGTKSLGNSGSKLVQIGAPDKAALLSALMAPKQAFG